MFRKQTSKDYSDLLPGIRQKTLVFGERTLMTEFLLGKDNILPEHGHPYEQTGYLVKRHIVLKIGETEHDTRPGDSWCIPMNVTHSAKILEDSIAIEIFSPVRTDYLPKGEKTK
jgi:quercetin dioxygenase-like cupin family protein